MADINSDRMDDAIEEMGGFIFPTPFDFLLSYFIYIYMYMFFLLFFKEFGAGGNFRWAQGLGLIVVAPVLLLLPVLLRCSDAMLSAAIRWFPPSNHLRVFFFFFFFFFFKKNIIFLLSRLIRIDLI